MLLESTPDRQRDGQTDTLCCSWAALAHNIISRYLASFLFFSCAHHPSIHVIHPLAFLAFHSTFLAPLCLSSPFFSFVRGVCFFCFYFFCFSPSSMCHSLLFKRSSHGHIHVLPTIQHH